MNSHRGIEQSRRDDLESLAYILIYLQLGQLPWSGLTIDDKSAKSKKILELKISTMTEENFKKWKIEKDFLDFVLECRSMGFEEVPDY